MPPDGEAAGLELQHEIEQFLYLEAELLDAGRFHEWYDLLADDVHYWMPVRENRLRRERDRELGAPTDLAYFDDDKQTLGQRIRRLDTGMAWAEDPPSRTRHVVGNVRVRPGAADGEFEVTSAFLLYRTRLETDQNLFAGRRDDVLRRAGDGGWRLARRRIVLDQNVILSKNLSVFF
jgi:biphenyl 2,3-dioxygenase beta subunit